jgi:hypothetical protein
MPRIPVQTFDTAPPAAQPILAELRERSLMPGTLLNCHAQMSTSPATLAAYMGMRNAIEQFGTLDMKTRTATMLSVSATDGAGYAQAINSFLCGRAGWSPEEVSEIAAGTFSDDAKIAALLEVARQAARNIGYVDDIAWQAARAHGWTVKELNDAFASVALTVMVDYFVHFAETPLDIPAAHVAASAPRLRREADGR